MDTLSEPGPQTKPSATSGGVDLRRIGLVWTILLIPIETGVALYIPDIRTGAYAGTVTLLLFDLPLIVLAVGSAGSIARRLRTRDFSLGVATMLVLVIAAAVTLPFHPSPSGLGVTVRLALAAVVAFEVSGLSERRLRYRVGAPLLIAASLQAILGLLQVARGGPVGLGTIGERTEFFVFGDVVGAQGTTLHPYVLAGFAVLAATVGIATLPAAGRHRLLWLIGIGISAIPLGITFGRTGAIGLIAVLGILGVGAYRDRERYGSAFAVVAFSALVPALVFSGGWVDRVNDTTADGLNASSHGRVKLVEQAFDLIESSPVVGVGPGRYAIVMEENPDVLPQVVHNVPLLIAAESGVVFGLAALVLLLLLGYRAFRTSIAASAVMVGLGVWMFLDKFTYGSPNGLVMFAIWLGVLDWLWVHRRPAGAGEASANEVIEAPATPVSDDLDL